MTATPASAIIECPGGDLPCLRKITYMLKQWLMQLGKICNFNGPVIHLGIDICSIVTAPGRTEVGIPYTLKVCRNSSGTG
jgi:hypothetical protein